MNWLGVFMASGAELISAAVIALGAYKIGRVVQKHRPSFHILRPPTWFRRT